MLKEKILFYALDHMGVQDGSYFVSKYNELVQKYGLKFPRGYVPKTGDSWCAIFISAIMMDLGVEDFPIEIGAHRMFYNFGNEYQVKEFPDSGLAIIAYDWQKSGEWIDHVGFAFHTNNGMVYSLEGNYNSGVGLRGILQSNQCIAGYIDLGYWLENNGYTV